ncbi:sensor histidine kinase [Hugenholtzia roseola]|uniref:sensor histidine kinase n=1 Tax=Hugenholtzia roseola TaxID=1002 RepID=UPI0003FB1566|nr:ATP-binding protein [Hugenholtzia roseola]
MASKMLYPRPRILASLLVLLGSMLAFCFFLLEEDYLFTTLLLGAALIYQIALLLKTLMSAEGELTELLEALRNDDFSTLVLPFSLDEKEAPSEEKALKAKNLKQKAQHFWKQTLQNSPPNELRQAVMEAYLHFQEIRQNKERDHQNLLTIIQHIGMGILAYNEKEEIELLNLAARRLLGVNKAEKLDDLQNFAPEWVSTVRQLKTGNRALVKGKKINGEPIDVSVYAIEINRRGESYKYLTFQNIHNELLDREMEAWQNLLRVLTHEIMNSVAPISSLAATIADESEYLKQKYNQNPLDFDDMQLAAQTIQRRSESLVNFMADFRNLSKLPEPKFEQVRLAEIFTHVETLFKADLQESEILFQVEMPAPSFFITADPMLIEQVLINLVKNAAQALESQDDNEHKKICLKSFRNEQGQAIISVKDNAMGIDADAISKIFIPFFSTKKGGSGIGLSLSQQIMRQHKGSISVISETDPQKARGTEFKLTFL